MEVVLENTRLGTTAELGKFTGNAISAPFLLMIATKRTSIRRRKEERNSNQKEDAPVLRCMVCIIPTYQLPLYITGDKRRDPCVRKITDCSSLIIHGLSSSTTTMYTAWLIIHNMTNWAARQHYLLLRITPEALTRFRVRYLLLRS